MNEYELVSIVIERRIEMISLLQWWGGISFAILAGSQILEKHLTVPILAIVDAFYLFFTFVSFTFILNVGAQLRASFQDLGAIENPSIQTQLMIQQATGGAIDLNRVIIGSVVLLVVLVVCAYPIWLYANNRRAT